MKKSDEFTTYYKVDVTEDPETGVLVYEEWKKDGKRHRDRAPAVIERDCVTGEITLEEWYCNGKLHREDGPAFIKRDRHGNLVEQKLFAHGEEMEWVAEARRQANQPQAASRGPAP